MSTSFFDVDRSGGDEWFVPTDVCRGPWAPDACHAGPPVGLLARAAERTVPGRQLVRLTVDLLRPIPHGGFSITASAERSGRTVAAASLSIVDGSGNTVATARSVHVAPASHSGVPTAPAHFPDLGLSRPGPFPLAEAAHGHTMFADGVEVLYPPGEGPEPGPTRLWLRSVPLLPDEEPSGFERICPLADCGNGVSRNADTDEYSFVNTDLTIVLHREPEGEWFGADTVSRWETTGIGMSDSLLFDGRGPVGRAIQTLVVEPVEPGGRGQRSA